MIYYDTYTHISLSLYICIYIYIYIPMCSVTYVLMMNSVIT